VPVIQMTVVAQSSRPRFTSRGELDAAAFATVAGIDFLCGACDRVVLARVVRSSRWRTPSPVRTAGR
jgi:hypothetical protein